MIVDNRVDCGGQNKHQLVFKCLSLVYGQFQGDSRFTEHTQVRLTEPDKPRENTTQLDHRGISHTRSLVVTKSAVERK